MGAEIGSFTEGKLTDLGVFDATSPAIVCAAKQNPAAVVVLHASGRDIETMIINGVFRKDNGTIIPCKAQPQIAGLISTRVCT